MRTEHSRRAAPPDSRRLRLLVAAAVVLALAGFGQLALGWMPALGSGPPPELQAAAPDGVTAGVASVSWVDMDHEEDDALTGPGYQMPLSMMPGMPAEGEQRLAVRLTLTNTAGVGRPVDPVSEFVLRNGGNGKSWEPVADTFEGLSRLGSASGASGVLYFDLPAPGDDQAKLFVDWKRPGGSLKLALPFNGTTLNHSHTS